MTDKRVLSDEDISTTWRRAEGTTSGLAADPDSVDPDGTDADGTDGDSDGTDTKDS
jgi:hypothetical protein